MSDQTGTIGCTVGVVRQSGGMLFFKNRDLEGPYVRNRITVFQSTASSHTLRGVNLKTGALEGVSIGVNRHRVCVANTHILSTSDITYDILCESLVDETQEKADVPRIVGRFLERNPVQGGRILVAGLDWCYLVEVLGQRFEMQELQGDVAITNTFSLLPHPHKASETRGQSSQVRLETANGHLKEITSTGKLKSLLRSHLPEKSELSICNHRQDGGGTESSHIIQIQGDLVNWSYLLGFPCENDYHSLELFR
jgi:hypothetical protein